MAEVKILVPGRHRVDQDNNDRLFIGSTVTLIKSDKNVIVDTGSFFDQKDILLALANNSLKPEDIDIVFLTHLHLDHVMNVSLFTRARIYSKHKAAYPGQVHLPSQGYLERTEIKDGLKLAKDIEFLLSPGHTADHVSLIVKTDQGLVVIAGDAIATASLADLNKKPLLFDDPIAYDQSRQKILKMADFIIPGHGDIFKVNK